MTFIKNHIDFDTIHPVSLTPGLDIAKSGVIMDAVPKHVKISTFMLFILNHVFEPMMKVIFFTNPVLCNDEELLMITLVDKF